MCAGSLFLGSATSTFPPAKGRVHWLGCDPGHTTELISPPYALLLVLVFKTFWLSFSLSAPSLISSTLRVFRFVNQRWWYTVYVLRWQSLCTTDISFFISVASEQRASHSLNLDVDGLVCAHTSPVFRKWGQPRRWVEESGIVFEGRQWTKEPLDVSETLIGFEERAMWMFNIVEVTFPFLALHVPNPNHSPRTALHASIETRLKLLPTEPVRTGQWLAGSKKSKRLCVLGVSLYPKIVWRKQEGVTFFPLSLSHPPFLPFINTSQTQWHPSRPTSVLNRSRTTSLVGLIRIMYLGACPLFCWKVFTKHVCSISVTGSSSRKEHLVHHRHPDDVVIVSYVPRSTKPTGARIS